MRLKTISITLLLSLGLMTAGCGNKEKSSEKSTTNNTQQTKKSKQVPLYTLRDGNESISVKLTKDGIDANINKPIVIFDFFATWCPPCKAEIPHLVDLQNKYKDKLKIIGVLVEKNKPQSELEAFKMEHKMNYFVSNDMDNIELASATADMLHQPQNFSIPMMVIFINGKYFRHYIGMVPEEMMESDIKEAIKKAK